MLTLKYPIENGVILNWDDTETIFDHTLKNVLRVNPEETAIMIADSVVATKKDCRMLFQMMFEPFYFAGVHIALSSYLPYNCE